MNSTSESLLIRLKADDNSDSWSQFVELYTPLIFYWARKNGLNQPDAADLAQDVLTIVFQKLPTWQYNPEKSFRGWLRTITLNRHRELFRRKTIKTTNASDNGIAEIVDPRSAESTWDANYGKELVASAMKMMQSDFAPETWEALQRLVLHGDSAAQIARESGVSAWTIYSAKNRLMTRLRSRLGDLLD